MLKLKASLKTTRFSVAVLRLRILDGIPDHSTPPQFCLKGLGRS